MAEFPLAVWIVIGAVGAACILGVFQGVATALRNEIELHNLRAETQRVRSEFMRRLREATEVLEVGEDTGDVDILPEPGEAPAPIKRKAA